MSHILIFIIFFYFNDNNQMKNELIIYLDEIKFKYILYEDHINRHMKLNEEIHQQVQDIKQVKT